MVPVFRNTLRIRLFLKDLDPDLVLSKLWVRIRSGGQAGSAALVMSHHHLSTSWPQEELKGEKNSRLKTVTKKCLKCQDCKYSFHRYKFIKKICRIRIPIKIKGSTIPISTMVVYVTVTQTLVRSHVLWRN